MKYAFAGDRKISCNILQFLIQKGYKPSALFVSNHKGTSHAQELMELANLDSELVFHGNTFKKSSSIAKMQSLDLDYIFGIHFPYIIPKAILDLPSIGFVNLHPAYLPFNKGWNTPSWAILDKTPYGATLHYMNENIDAGDIIHQKQLDVLPFDTADSLYQRVLKLEEEVFYEAFESLKSLDPPRRKQTQKGTKYSKSDLNKVKEIDLDTEQYPSQLIDNLRALTTNNISEAAFFVKDGHKFGIQVKLFKMDD